MSETKVTKSNATLTLERVFPTSKSTMWDAWTNADIFAKWWGPQGWATTVKHIDVTAGGSLLYGMKCEDQDQKDWYGKSAWGKFVYDAVNPQDNFGYTDYFCDEDGNVDDSMPVTTSQVIFEEVDGGVKVTNISTYASEEAFQQVLAMGMEEGITQTWDRLAALVQNK